MKKNEHSNRIRFNNSDTIFITTRQSHFFGCLKNNRMIEGFDRQQKTVTIFQNNENVVIDMAHGCKNPDECFIDEENKRIFIIEKKFQQRPGSVCEKIQTAEFKIWQYSRILPTYNIIYMYCLSDWFETNCRAALLYLNEQNVPVFWGNHEDYKQQIINFIITN